MPAALCRLVMEDFADLVTIFLLKTVVQLLLACSLLLLTLFLRAWYAVIGEKMRLIYENYDRRLQALCYLMNILILVGGTHLIAAKNSYQE